MIVLNILGYFGQNKQNSYAALSELQHDLLLAILFCLARFGPMFV